MNALNTTIGLFLTDHRLLLIITIFIILVLISLLVLIKKRNFRNTKEELKKRQQNDLVLRLKRINNLRHKGAVSKVEFEKRRESVFQAVSINNAPGNKSNGKKQLKQYFKAVEESDDNVIIVQDGIIRFANQKTLQTLGYLKEEFYSKRVIDFIHPNDQNIFTGYLVKVMNNEKLINNNIFRFIDNTGDTRWLELSSLPISLGSKTATLNFFDDITVSKKAEKELLEIQDRFHTLFEESPIPLWELDITDIKEYINSIISEKGVLDFKEYFESHPESVSRCANMLKVTQINRANLELFMLKNKKKISDYFIQILCKELKDIFTEWLVTIAGAKEIFEGEAAFNTLNGQKKNIISRWIIVSNGNKTYSKAIVSMIDITEHKSITNQIQSLSQFRESIIDNASLWLNVFDRELNVIVWNKAAENISGYLRSEVVGHNKIWEWLYPDTGYRKKVIDYIFSMINKKSTDEDFETMIRCKNGKTRVIIWNFKNFNGAGNKKIGLIAISRDHTDKKKMEEKLKYIASHDALSGVYNRAFFEEQLHLQFDERNSRNAILLLDIDGLKYVNDTIGHQHGDKMIINLSRILRKTFRPGDVIARIGGDEFAVLIRNASGDKLKSVAERFYLNIDAFNQDLKKGQYPLNVSYGYSISEPGSKSAMETFKEADDRLYENKIPKREEVIKSALAAIRATMLEKDSVAEEHMERLKSTASLFGEIMNFDQEDKEKLILATELHDIGKVVIPDNILNKSGSLSQDEFDIIKKHSTSGYRIAKATPMIEKISEYILYSHERWDGTGYPEGLKGKNIPLISRMVYIIDVYDTIINDRPYKNANSEKEAIKEIKRCGGTQFDPALVNIFIAKVLKIKKLEFAGQGKE